MTDEPETDVMKKPKRKRPIIKDTSIVVDRNGKHTFHNPTKVEMQIYRKFENGAENGMQFMYRRKKICILTLKMPDGVVKRQGIGWSRWFPYPKKLIKVGEGVKELPNGMRGVLTEKIQEIARARIGREITTTELKLYPYIDYVMKNNQRLDISKINGEEREILSMLRKKGHIDGGASGLDITKEFYDYIQEVLWEGYVVGGDVSPLRTYPSERYDEKSEGGDKVAKESNNKSNESCNQ